MLNKIKVLILRLKKPTVNNVLKLVELAGIAKTSSKSTKELNALRERFAKVYPDARISECTDRVGFFITVNGYRFRVSSASKVLYRERFPKNSLLHVANNYARVQVFEVRH